MWKKEISRNLNIFFRAGLPYTLVGMLVIFAGIYGLKYFFADSQYLTAILFLWLALFWFVYQPLFKRRIKNISRQME
jgi:uncharacterized membrane protein YfcA